MKSTPFTADIVLEILLGLPRSGPYYVAYSGGLDSHVLLHSLWSVKSQLSVDIHALHVNHGISDSADSWAVHCRKICNSLGISFTLLKLNKSCPDGESMEAWARRLRYQFMANEMHAKSVLLTAHHLDDQAETLLLQMIRGAGVKGLAAMPMLKKENEVWHARPFLNTCRRQLLDYAREHDLQWIEDESNINIAHDRNFLRREILPTLRQRWPAISETLTRVAAHQADAMLLLDELAEADLLICIDQSRSKLNIEQLLKFSSARQVNVIRYWLRAQHLPVPDTSRMHQILETLLQARKDASPVITWPGCDIRRYRQQLYASIQLPPHDASRCIDWKLDTPCQLGDDLLSAKLKEGEGIKQDICPDNHLQVRFRQGGEKIQLKNKRHRQELKKLFQEEEIPPWLRNRIPLLYAGDVLIAVADLWIDAAAYSNDNELSWQIDWTGLDKFVKSNCIKNGN